jgi:hypothetical protein
MRRIGRWLVVAVALVVLIPGVAKAEDPLFVPWTSLLPGFTAGYDPSSVNLCKQGHESCVRSVIREMDQRLDGLAAECDHDAVFALTYLRTTEEYYRFWQEGHFNEPNWLNHYDAVFADYYFDAFDNWTSGNKGAVSQAWKVAFDASDRRLVSGIGSVFLGMNAHINRDLPYVLASIGMVAPDGTSRKADHDKVNEFLNRISDSVFPELAARFDPTADDLEINGTSLDNFLQFQMIPAWREQAWRNAQLLVAAGNNALLRSLVRTTIETYAATTAQTLKTLFSYNALSSFDANDRDAYCTVNGQGA